MRILGVLSVATLLTVFTAAPVHAWSVHGFVACDANQNGQLDTGDILAPGVLLRVASTTGPFVGTGVTDSLGHYSIALPNVPDTYLLTLGAALPAGFSFVVPASGQYTFATTDTVTEFDGLWLVFSQLCVPPPPPPPPPGKCWMTAGGVKFAPETGSLLAENGPTDSFGGNVYPSCSGVPGNGGNWNHISHSSQLHFQGTQIVVLTCGNATGIPPGSTSPATPFNYILFGGKGTLKGIDGNTADFDPVYFLSYVEDRNEPGSNGAKDGALIDRYWLYVFSDPTNVAGSGRFLVNGDSNLADFKPVPITGGNLQLHISSCDNPPLKP